MKSKEEIKEEIGKRQGEINEETGKRLKTRLGRDERRYERRD